LLQLGEMALSHGLVNEFAELFDDLVKNTSDQASTTDPALKSAVKAYATVKAGLEKSIDKDDLAQSWKARLSCRDESSKHYALLYTAAIPNPPEVQSRLAM